MTFPDIEFNDVKPFVDDGSEYRNVLLRTREGDIAKLVDLLANKTGFVRPWAPRIEIVDDNKIMISIPTNSGTSTEGYIYLGLEVFIPLTKQEIADSNKSVQEPPIVPTT